MDLSNAERISQALDTLGAGLRPSCEKKWHQTYGDDWLTHVSSKLRTSASAHDISGTTFLLGGMKATWDETSARALSPDARSLVCKVHSTHTASANKEDFSDEDAILALHGMERLLDEFDSHDEQQIIYGLRDDLMPRTIFGRISLALDFLSRGLEPACEQRWRDFYGEDWLTLLDNKLKRSWKTGKTSDPAFLLNGMKATWNETFAPEFSPDVRSLVFEVHRTRNAWAHKEDISPDDSIRALDSMERLLDEFNCGDEQQIIRELRYDLMRQIIGASTVGESTIGAPVRQPQRTEDHDSEHQTTANADSPSVGVETEPKARQGVSSTADAPRHRSAAETAIASVVMANGQHQLYIMKPVNPADLGALMPDIKAARLEGLLHKTDTAARTMAEQPKQFNSSSHNTASSSHNTASTSVSGTRVNNSQSSLASFRRLSEFAVSKVGPSLSRIVVNPYRFNNIDYDDFGESLDQAYDMWGGVTKEPHSELMSDEYVLARFEAKTTSRRWDQIVVPLYAMPDGRVVVRQANLEELNELIRASA
ncbi:Swt1 family HEPN domain-containing protein [Candidatus Poriferisodalis sp.]|uniref:Swt1 family HEPN domain-containing protein n=1 Tax=Candidatus Poriferisodalis sp. TaxID=3101277 RepID=UPI003B0209F1